MSDSSQSSLTRKLQDAKGGVPLCHHSPTFPRLFSFSSSHKRVQETRETTGDESGVYAYFRNNQWIARINFDISAVCSVGSNSIPIQRITFVQRFLFAAMSRWQGKRAFPNIYIPADDALLLICIWQLIKFELFSLQLADPKLAVHFYVRVFRGCIEVCVYFRNKRWILWAFNKIFLLS